MGETTADETTGEDIDDVEQLVRRLMAEDEGLADGKDSLEALESAARQLVGEEADANCASRHLSVERGDAAEALDESDFPGGNEADREGRQDLDSEATLMRRLFGGDEEVEEVTDEQGEEAAEDLDSEASLVRRLFGEDEEVASEEAEAAEVINEILAGAGNQEISEGELAEIVEAVEQAVEEINSQVESGTLVADGSGAPLRRLSAFLEEGSADSIGDLNAPLDLAGQTVQSVQTEADGTPAADESAPSAATGAYDAAASRTKAAAEDLQVALQFFLRSLGDVLREGPVAEAQSVAVTLKSKVAQGGEHIGGVTSNPRERVRKSLSYSEEQGGAGRRTHRGGHQQS